MMSQVVNKRSDGMSLDMLGAAPRWVTWRHDVRNGKRTKVPYNPVAHGAVQAKANDATTWGTRAQAGEKVSLLERAEGVGIELGPIDDNWALGGIDLDTCRDPESGALEPWAEDILRSFKTYAEVSPSGTGVKLLFYYPLSMLPALRATMGGAEHGKQWKQPGHGDHPPGIELYISNRYFAVTDQRIEWLPDEVHQAFLEDLLRLIRVTGPQFSGALQAQPSLPEAAPAQEPSPQVALPPPATDLWDRIRSKARFDTRLRRLLAQDFAGMADQSRSGKAMAMGGALFRAGFSYEDVAQALRTWPVTSEWAREKGDINQGREMLRLWEKVSEPEEPEADQPEQDAPRQAPKPPSTLPVIRFGDVAPNLDAADFVEGLLTDGAMSIVYGPSNCGKTFFATDLGLHVAAGWEWRGREVEAGGVIYCALEGSHGISNRVAAFKQEHGIVDGLAFSIVPVSINLLDPDADRQRLVDTIRQESELVGRPVKMVVIDTLSRALSGGNENAPDDMGAFVSNVDFIRQSVGPHLMVIHHSGKDQAQGARGHSLLRAATDTEIEISRENKDAPSIARVTKQREMEIDGAFVFTLKTVTLGHNKRGKPVTSCVVVSDDRDAPAQTKRPPRLPDGAQVALDALSTAISKYGVRRGHMPDIPGQPLTVTRAQWVAEHHARSPAPSDAAKDKAFDRAVTTLAARRLALLQNSFAWAVKDDQS